jgi:arylsulfatase A-like enzyme
MIIECRNRKSWSYAWGALMLMMASSIVAMGDDPKPNVLFIVGDDMGYADVGFHGCADIPTPNLDALAASGVRCTNGYVSGPYCSPTRAALLTGRYQTRFGHEFNPSADPHGLPVTETTLADRLREHGYATSLVGKWHLGNQPRKHPQARGFDEFFGFLGGSHSYFETNGILRGKTPVTELEYTTDAFANEAVSFIDRNKNRPWFLYLAFNAVHTPMHATEDRLKRFAHTADPQRRKYAAMMVAMDEAIGKVIQELKKTQQLEKTFVAFISDNGGPMMKGVTVNGSNNAPLRGSKRTTLEGGVRVPFLVSWPGKIAPGVFDKPVIQIDLHATALRVTQAPVSNASNLDGVNLLPYFTGDVAGEPHDALYWRFGKQMAIRSGDWKLVRYDTTADGNDQPEISSLKLYNLGKDIHEDHDLSQELPEKVQELKTKWERWNQSNVEPLWGGNGKAQTKESAGS